MKKSSGESFGEDYFEKGVTKGLSPFEGYEYASTFDEIAKYLVRKFSPRVACDVGCAKGFFVYALRKRGVEAYGVDVSDYALSKSPSEVKPFLFKVDLNKDKMPFPNNHFDLITCLQTIEHVSNLENVLSELWRVLKPNGVVFLTTPEPKNEREAKFRDKTHVNVHDTEFWVNLFQAHNFHVKLGRYYPLSRGNILKRFPFSDKFRKVAYFIVARTTIRYFLLCKK